MKVIYIARIIDNWGSEWETECANAVDAQSYIMKYARKGDEWMIERKATMDGLFGEVTISVETIAESR